MQESSKGRKLTAQERQELMRSPAKLLQTLLGPLGVLYSGLKPAAIETVASQAVSGHTCAECNVIEAGSAYSIRMQGRRPAFGRHVGLHLRWWWVGVGWGEEQPLFLQPVALQQLFAAATKPNISAEGAVWGLLRLQHSGGSERPPGAGLLQCCTPTEPAGTGVGQGTVLLVRTGNNQCSMQVP
jgi:hypothetical protein